MVNNTNLSTELCGSPWCNDDVTLNPNNFNHSLISSTNSFNNNLDFSSVSQTVSNISDDSVKSVIDSIHKKKSLNQRLAGPPNPKTLIAPIIVPPSHDLSFWKADNLINHSHINTESHTDTFLSGYNVSTCCDRTDAFISNTCTDSLDNNLEDILEDVLEDILEPYNYEGVTDNCHDIPDKINPINNNVKITSPTPITQQFLYPSSIIESYTPNPYPNPKPYHNHNPNPNPYPSTCLKPNQYPQQTNIQLNPLNKNIKIKSPTPITQQFLYPSSFVESYKVPSSSKQKNPNIKHNQNGWVNTACGYNPSQLSVNLPTNLLAGNCEKQPIMKNYNKNLFTQNIQPDIYSVNEIIEPINSNIGISYTQQLNPLTSSRSDGKGLTFTEHDPRLTSPNKLVPEKYGVTESSIYDPRFTGYGTSYRSYTDDLLGQTKFYYDDIDSIRMPNYITRSNIDHLPFADTYGPLNETNKSGNIYTNDIRALTQEAFLRNSLQHRTELQERLLRKRNNELWELRKFPQNRGSNSRRI
jgi:hypothetical protein